MKYIYLVDYWVPFPSSEYGGLIAAVAESDHQCHDILLDWRDECEGGYDDRILTNVSRAVKIAVNEDTEFGIIDSFIT